MAAPIPVSRLLFRLKGFFRRRTALAGMALVLGQRPTASAQTPPQVPTAQIPIPATGRRIADFIPPGYGILPNGQATGDLNHDGRPDVALVLRHLDEDSTDHQTDSLPRQLLLLLRTAQGYSRAARSAQLIRCLHCDDNLNEPLSELTIEQGVLTIKQAGARKKRWQVSARFQYRGGDFFLVRETRLSYHSNRFCGGAGRELHQRDFLTGAYHEEKDSERCRPLVRKNGRHPPQPLRRLADYVPEP